MANSSPFWNAYSSAVRRHLLPGIELPDNVELFVLPFTEPFTEATGPLTDEGLNYLLYHLANTTLAADGSKGNYAQELNTYLETVSRSSLLDPQAKKSLEEAEKALESAQKGFDETEAAAKEQYDNTPPPKPPFEQWVLQNWPPYAAAKRTLDSARTQQLQAYNQYWGQINLLDGRLDNLTKALDTTTLHHLYNMSVRKDGGATTFAPYYNSLGLKDKLNNWIQGGGEEQTFVEVKVDSATPPGSAVEKGIFLKLTTKGIDKFDINAGQWNVDGVKTLYPNREAGAPDVLDPKFARPISFLLAYDLKLEVEIKEIGAGQNAKFKNSATTNDKPYAAVLGILGQHFPPN